jgi:hypothetical protein
LSHLERLSKEYEDYKSKHVFWDPDKLNELKKIFEKEKTDPARRAVEYFFENYGVLNERSAYIKICKENFGSKSQFALGGFCKDGPHDSDLGRRLGGLFDERVVDLTQSPKKTADRLEGTQKPRNAEVCPLAVDEALAHSEVEPVVVGQEEKDGGAELGSSQFLESEQCASTASRKRKVGHVVDLRKKAREDAKLDFFHRVAALREEGKTFREVASQLRSEGIACSDHQAMQIYTQHCPDKYRVRTFYIWSVAQLTELREIVKSKSTRNFEEIADFFNKKYGINITAHACDVAYRICLSQKEIRAPIRTQTRAIKRQIKNGC